MVLVQFILFFISSQCTFILYFKSSWDKIASTARNWINSAPQAAATTFAFSYVFVLLLVFTGMKSLGKAGACSVGDLQNCCCQETAKWYLLKRKIKIIMLNFHKYNHVKNVCLEYQSLIYFPLILTLTLIALLMIILFLRIYPFILLI